MPPWEPDSPIMLATGRLVCKLHRQVVCVQCCVDYSFLESPLASGSEEDMDDDVVFATGFTVFQEGEDSQDNNSSEEVYSPLMPRPPLQYRPDGTLIVPEIHLAGYLIPAETPQQLFPCQLLPHRQFPRFTHRTNHNHFLIYTDGSCLNNGQPNATAGWGIVFRPTKPGFPELGWCAGRLEDCSPSGEAHEQTSNRAELRAVIAALQFRFWYGEGWKRLVIATDSEYVTKGATEWVHSWGRNAWVTRNRTPVKNRDLWEELLREVLRSQECGMEIRLWRIPRALNTEADSVARAGAREERCRNFGPTFGVLV